MVFEKIKKLFTKEITTKFNIGDITVREPTWKEYNDAWIIAEVGNGVIKNSIFYRELEYKITDKTKEVIDALTKEEGMKLREIVKKMVDKETISKARKN